MNRASGAPAISGVEKKVLMVENRFSSLRVYLLYLSKLSIRQWVPLFGLLTNGQK
jgi:hypothetical protein